MADLKISGNKKIKTLKAEFKAAYGSSLRVYTTPAARGPFADDEATLASVATKKGGELSVGGNMQVGNFEKKFAETFGIGVQVANKDDSKLADNSLTLVQAGK